MLVLKELFRIALLIISNNDKWLANDVSFLEHFCYNNIYTLIHILVSSLDSIVPYQGFSHSERRLGGSPTKFSKNNRPLVLETIDLYCSLALFPTSTNPIWETLPYRFLVQCDKNPRVSWNISNKIWDFLQLFFQKFYFFLFLFLGPLAAC